MTSTIRPPRTTTSRPRGRDALPDVDDGGAFNHQVRRLARGAAGAGENDENGDGWRPDSHMPP